MKFSQPVADLIRRRFSCRKYLPQPIPAQTQDALRHCLESLPLGPFGSPTRFQLIAGTEQASSVLKGLGTYGFIRGATAFIAGAVGPAKLNLEDFGYTMEQAVLLATDLGLGTCWLGGTFTRSRFAQRIQLQDEETIPAVTAAGLMDDPAQARRGLIRQMARGHQRLAWETLFFSGNFAVPLPQTEAGDFAIPLEMVRLAPSASNRQPWRIIKNGDSWHFYLRRTPGYREGFFQRLLKLADLQRVDMGIAMCHFELAARELNLPGQWTLADPGIETSDELTEYIISWRVVPTKVD
jgi:nitroreductase